MPNGVTWSVSLSPAIWPRDSRVSSRESPSRTPSALHSGYSSTPFLCCHGRLIHHPGSLASYILGNSPGGEPRGSFIYHPPDRVAPHRQSQCGFTVHTRRYIQAYPASVSDERRRGKIFKGYNGSGWLYRETGSFIGDTDRRGRGRFV